MRILAKSPAKHEFAKPKRRASRSPAAAAAGQNERLSIVGIARTKESVGKPRKELPKHGEAAKHQLKPSRTSYEVREARK
ncbi:hypothetical protein L596_009270 [Steinernema carpocapsae]|uniref:Uncharacterized protein n=1 Tax=Steinernema carpocapsae TaxID=34508 RepID=A0A4U5PF54_STECR|nr:hypothetical protein L596_009270 [Steinernema carpocapsae]